MIHHDPQVRPSRAPLLSYSKNQTKRMIGHMTRQIMEARGYQLDRSGVVIRRAGNIFFSASRYKMRTAP